MTADVTMNVVITKDGMKIDEENFAKTITQFTQHNIETNSKYVYEFRLTATIAIAVRYHSYRDGIWAGAMQKFCCND